MIMMMTGMQGPMRIMMMAEDDGMRMMRIMMMAEDEEEPLCG